MSAPGSNPVSLTRGSKLGPYEILGLLGAGGMGEVYRARDSQLGRDVKREHPSWGARKIRERLIRRFSGIPIPAKSTIHAVLDRHGLVERRGRVRRRAQGTPLSLGQRPNELWCTDYKGEFLLGNHKYCYPLTVTDHASRFLLTCEALSSTCEDYAFTVFERLFQERGLPASIRSDNGVPFASAHA